MGFYIILKVHRNFEPRLRNTRKSVALRGYALQGHVIDDVTRKRILIGYPNATGSQKDQMFPVEFNVSLTTIAVSEN